MDNSLFRHDVELKDFTTFGIPAKAKLFAEYKSVRELEKISRSEEYLNNEVLHIGGGSNLLFLSDFNGLVLHSAINGIIDYRKDDTTVYVIAGAGVKWIELVDHCVDRGYAGLENLAGIPGEAGASAVQNVGAYGVEAKDTLFAVECFDTHTRKVVTLRAEECGFGYRDSIFKREAKDRYFVLRVSFRLTISTEAHSLNYGPLRSLAERIGHTPTISEVRDEIIAIRNNKLPDPPETGSAGSFFKNPVISRFYYEQVVLKFDPTVPCYDLPDEMVKLPAGWLIEHAGLKGKRIGGAEVYPKQCLVIVNEDNATANDVTELAHHICREVKRIFAVELEPEVNFIDTRIRIRVLGSGTSKGVPEVGCHCDVCDSSDPRDKRLRASVLVRTHGMELMIDTSPDFREQALRADMSHLDAVLLTHTHFDHVGGIDDLRPLMIFKPMPVYLRPDVATDLRRRLDYCFREHPYPGVPKFDLHEITSDRPFHIRGLEIQPIEVMHGKLPILGYRIGSFAYVTDAKTIDSEEKEKLYGLDALIVNALRKTDHFAHFTLEEALKLIAEVKPRRAYLTHISHELGKAADIEKELPDNVFLAYDGLEIEID